jgi:hypothetical protein
MKFLLLKKKKRVLDGSFQTFTVSALRREHQLLQRLINGKLFMLNGHAPKPDIGPKILTAQETWELIAAIVKASLTPPPELENDGI